MSCAREPNAEPIKGYRLIEPLGSGGFGEVWKCEAPGGLFKAIKFVFGNLNSLDVEGVRAEQELHALERVKEVRHPFVLSMDRIEVVNGELVIVMELADKNLHDCYLECQASGLVGIPRNALLRYIRDAAEALDHMNERHNLQHLDIKPRNLFVISDRVKVADFGLVKHLERTSSSGLLGGVTPLYAPPETFHGKISDRSDQYSLGIVYQELLTGQRPFTGKNVRQLAQQHMEGEPELRALPEGERPVVARALAKDPAKRFPNCMAFVRALFAARPAVRSELLIPEEVATGATVGAGARAVATLVDLEIENLSVVEDRAQRTEDRGPRTERRCAGGNQDELSPVLCPASADEEEARLGITIAQPQSGALRPTVVLGVGSFGRWALRELRCRLIDRFGDLRKVPAFRFLYVDTDLEALQASAAGPPETAFSRNEVYHLPLQPVQHYRRRMLEHLAEWLPREKLYAMPRALQTQGTRALGRLAFADNYLRFMARLRAEFQQAAHPDALYQSVTETGLALRDALPRVYVLAAAGGGGSGCFVDLGYALKRLLHQLRQSGADVVGLLFCGTPGDPAMPKAEQGNVYATLTELSHFADSAIPFATQYSADGPRLVDEGAPYNCVYLLQVANRAPEALRDVVAHLGSYLFHELTTPLGLHLDRSRRVAPPPGGTFFRSFGTYGVWFPRGLLLRTAARQACRRLAEDWQVPGEASNPALVTHACKSAWADPNLRPDAVCLAIEESARASFEGTPEEALTALLLTLEEQSQQSVAMDDPGSWARQALGRVRDWVGLGSESAVHALPGPRELRKSRAAHALGLAAGRVAEFWDQQLVAVLAQVMEPAGRRLAAAEAALTGFLHLCEHELTVHRTRLAQQAARTQDMWQQLETTLENCLAGSGGFTFFGARPRRLLRAFIDQLAIFARQRLGEEIAAAGLSCVTLLHGRLADRLREMTFCRQRLRALCENFDLPGEDADEMDATRLTTDVTLSHSPVPSTESFWEAIRQSTTSRVVLPEGQEDLEKAAGRFLHTLKPEVWTQLDEFLQEHVLAQLGGLTTVCASAGNLARALAAPLVEQAAVFLSDHLPITDVAEVVRAQGVGENGPGQPGQARLFAERAAPSVAGTDPAQQKAFLLIPASEAGKTLGEEARQETAGLQVVLVPGQANLLYCREQGYLSAEDVQRLARPCRAAYENAATAPQSSPHARFDLVDWVPLDP